jgi:hypothetical protein
VPGLFVITIKAIFLSKRGNYMNTQSQSFRDLIEAGKLYSAKQSPPEPVEKPPHPQADFLAAMVEAGQKYSGKISHNKKDYDKDLTKEDKMRLCTHQSGHYGIIKLINGRTKKVPRHCNHCKACYRVNAKKLQDKVEAISANAQEAIPNGQWRKKIVNEETEAQSLKKHIKRNQDSRHLEMACSEPGKSEIWAYVEDEPGKDMNEVYGEVAQPEDINFDDLYALNRETGKKLSKGSAFKSSGTGAKKEDTERVLMPEIIIKDASRQREAEDIIYETNYIEKAIDAPHAARLYAYQFKFILKELERANIKIAAIRRNYYNMAKDELLADWNGNVKYWQMSVNTPLSKDSEVKTDNVSRLVFPEVYEKSEPVVN